MLLNNKCRGLRRLTALLFILTAGVCINGNSEESTSIKFIVNDFESSGNLNQLGGTCGAWEKDPNDRVEYCTLSYKESDKDSGRGTVLSLEFKVGSEDYNGYFSKLNGVNLDLYDSLDFYVKGGNKHPVKFKIELKNAFSEVGVRYVSQIKKSWQKVSIPLDEFRGLTNRTKMEEFVIVFEGRVLGDSGGELYIDDISFSGTGKNGKNSKSIAHQMAERKEQALKIANLPDEQFLEEISKKTFRYFWDEASKITGFVKDRSTHNSPSSVAATGFGLAAICIADFRGWVTHEQAYTRVKKILLSLKNKCEGEFGYFYHFVNKDSGTRVWRSELSSIDTALLMGGVLTVKEYFPEKDIKNLCSQLYADIEWIWMMDPETKAIFLGWTPETGFEKFSLWDMFGEQMLMYVLGIGAPNGYLPPESWYSFRRPLRTYKDYTYIFCESESLFTSLYSHAFVDFRNKHDKYADYWENSRRVVNSNIAFAAENQRDFKTYREGFWGISAGDGPNGYKNYGATPFSHDGTVVPYAMCGAMPFVPEKAISTLKHLLVKYGGRVWDDRYGFVSAFNLDRNWFAGDHIGIDLGISLLMIENYRTGFIWKYFMKNKYVKRGLKKAGFKNGTKEEIEGTEIGTITSKTSQKEYHARKVNGLNELTGDNATKYDMLKDIEVGEYTNSTDLDAAFEFGWDEDNLYFVIDVTDNKVIGRRSKEEIYKDDCVELFISPLSEILNWGSPEDFQIVFAPNSNRDIPVVYAFFQKMDPGDNIDYKIEKKHNGYKIKAAIKWNFLGMIPQKDVLIGMSVAVHDIDKQDDAGKKANWSFKIGEGKILLGRMLLK
ncbi:glucoamylase family protein [Elusimicrobiota bacterium]